jgi:hypothetical protein
MNRPPLTVLFLLLGLLAAPAYAANPAELAGDWQGTYYYPANPTGPTQAPVSFTAQLQVNGTTISGRTTESNTFGDKSSTFLYANLNGIVTTGGRLNFNKQYDGTAGVSHSVAYSGTLDSSGTHVVGNWVTGTGFSGRFEMTQARRAAQSASCLTLGQPYTRDTTFIMPFSNRCDHNVQVAVCAVRAQFKNIIGWPIPAHGSYDVSIGNVPPILKAPWSETDMQLCDRY